ncbi:hypothetical protein WK30_10380 [Burkholderia vietnamiensis]|nr:hypothetical protein WJ57_29895 [Burkholderia vietnamiensis]KVS03774.1 hypothetical protein WK30_10380 [Burkholderia vietnamiensis]
MQMPRFTVTVEEVVRHTITVEAEDESEAGRNAVESLIENGPEAFNSEVADRGVFVCLPA